MGLAIGLRLGGMGPAGGTNALARRRIEEHDKQGRGQGRGSGSGSSSSSGRNSGGASYRARAGGNVRSD